MSVEPRITVVGLGPGDAGLLTRQTAEILRTGRVFLRTRIHPTVESMPEARDWPSFDHLYDTGETFESVYTSIVNELIEACADGPIVYAVPGHPLFGEATVRLLLTSARDSDVSVTIVPAVSFLDSVVAALEIDALDSELQIVDALDLATALESQPYSGGLFPISPLQPAIVAQIYSDRVASAVKLALSELYPNEHKVTIVRGTGTSDEVISNIPLVELDRQPVDHLSSLFVPKVDPLDFNRVGAGLQRIVARLRAPGGCPWDREQTHQSLTRHMLEEAYEAIDAIEQDAPADLQEELGDVLLQVYLHAQIAEEAGDFALEDVIQTLSSKLIRRHPHVFGDRQISTAGDVVKAWDQIKQEERTGNDEKPASLFASIPTSLPALSRAQTVYRRARSLGIEFPDAEPAQDRRTDSSVDIARQLSQVVAEADAAGIDAEQALRHWTNSLIERSEVVVRQNQP